MSSAIKPFSYNFLYLSIITSIFSANTYAENIESSPQTLATIVSNASSAEDEDEKYIVPKIKTALPLDLSVKETPQSVSVITRQRIDDQQLKTVLDVAENTTGLVVQQYESNRAGIYSRGFKVDNYQIEGIPTTYSDQFSAGEVFNSTAIMERVEVVRGATGLMTGPGNPSAAVNMIRKKADSRVPQANLQVGGGSWNNYNVMGDVANALNQSGSLRGRAVISYEDTDSFRDNFNKTSLSTLLTTEYDLSDQTVISAGISYSEDDTHAPTWGGLPATDSNGKAISWSRSTTIAPNWARWETNYTNVFADITHTFDNDWQLKASYDHGDRDSHSKLLYVYGNPDPNDGSGVTGGMGQYIDNTQQDTATLQLSGDFKAFGKEHDFTLGYQYSNQDWGSNYRPVQCEDQATNAWCSFNLNNFYQWDVSNALEPSWGDETLYERHNIKQNSIYGVTRWSVLDSLKLIVGGRLTDYEKSGYGLYTTAYTQKFDHQFIPYAGLIYDITPQISTYASYTSIFQPQKYKNENGQYLDPVEGNNYELGIKGEFLDSRLNTSAAVFRIEQNNYGVKSGTVDFGQGPEDVYKAIDGATSIGFEVEVSGEILPQWNLTAGYAQFRLEDQNGSKLDKDRPQKTFNLFSTYDLKDQFAPLTVGAGIRWQGDTEYSVPNGILKQDNFAILDLMARYQVNSDVSLQLNLNNVADKKYYTISGQQVTFNEPRNLNLKLNYKF